MNLSSGDGWEAAQLKEWSQQRNESGHSGSSLITTFHTSDLVLRRQPGYSITPAPAALVFISNPISYYLTSIKLISNAKFVELYVSSGSSSRAEDGFEYINTFRCVTDSEVCTAPNMFVGECVLGAEARKVIQIKLKFVSLKGNSAELHVHCLDVSGRGLSGTQASPAQTSPGVPPTNSTLQSTNLQATPNAGGLDMLGLFCQLNQMKASLLKEVEDMVDAKLSPINARLDHLQRMVQVTAAVAAARRDCSCVCRTDQRDVRTCSSDPSSSGPSSSDPSTSDPSSSDPSSSDPSTSDPSSSDPSSSDPSSSDPSSSDPSTSDPSSSDPSSSDCGPIHNQ